MAKENFPDLINHHEKCRLCLTYVDDGIRFQITKEIEKRTFELLDVHLIPSEIYSNYICDLCNLTLSNYSEYKSTILLKQRQLSLFLSRVKEDARIDDEVLNLGIEVYDVLQSELCADNHVADLNQSSLNSSLTTLTTENVEQHLNAIEMADAMKEFQQQVDDVLTSDSKSSSTVTAAMRDDDHQRNETVLTTSSSSSSSPHTIEENKETSSVIEEYLDSSESGSSSDGDDEECEWIEENESEHFTSTTSDELNCQFCHEIFYNQVDLMLHINIDHKESLKNNESTQNFTTTCNICGKEFKKSSLFHYLRYHAVKVLECDFCGQKFSTKYFLRNHMMSHISKYTRELKFRCDECSKHFASNSLLCSHRLYAHSMRDRSDLTCRICFKQLKTKSCLKMHVESVHSKITRATCEICCKVYSNKYERDKHFKLNHLDDNNREYFVCQHCGKLFRSAELLRKHKNSHLEAKIICNFDRCDKKFKTKQKLDQHRKSVHLRSVECKCSFPGCEKLFKSTQSCMFHYRVEHENYRAKCPVAKCNWNGTRRDYMKRHLKRKHQHELSSEKLEEFIRKTYEMMLA